MASARRRSNSSVKSDIFDRPQLYDFFQAVRLLEKIAADESRTANLELPDPVGRGVEPKNAAIKIRSAVPLGFAAAEVTSVRRPRSGGPIEMIQTLVGLTGPSGVLPHALSELTQVSVRERNPALRDFFDIFNNRLAGHLFDAWAKYRIALEKERARTLRTAEPIDRALKSIVGLGLPTIANRTATPDATLVCYGGLLSREGRSSAAVESALSGALGQTVRVEQFFGEWLAIAPADRTKLPDRLNPEGSFARLGEDSVVGGRSFDLQSSVRLHIGPLGYDFFRSLLPDGHRALMLSDMAALALGPDKAFHVRLELLPNEVPDLKLGGDRDDPGASRLGWNSWLGASRPRRSPVAAEFRPAPHLR